MPVPAGVIFPTPFTNAAVAALVGWTRVTSLDDRYVKGAAAATEADQTGGSATHGHTSPSHTHSIASHSHTGNANSSTASAGVTSGTSSSVTPQAHTHTVPDSDATSGTSGGTVATWQAFSNDPDFVRVIFIESDGSPAGIPAGAWAWWEADPLPTDWSLPAAAQDVFLKGATPGGDAGATGGADTHAHTADAHTHTANHTHTSSSATGIGSPSSAAGAVGSGTLQANNHAHAAGSITYSSTTASASATSADTGTGNGEPPWTKLAVMQNDTGGDDLQAGTIGAFLGLLANIPDAWDLMDGAATTVDMRGQFAKGVAALGEIGDTGGAAGHDHTDPAGHTHASHTHAITIGGITGSSPSDSSGTTAAANGHTHTSTSSAGVGFGSTAQTVDAVSDSQPPFRTVQFIRFTGTYVVTNDTPADAGTVVSPVFTFEWTNSNGDASYTAPQNDFQVEVSTSPTMTPLVYDSGQIVSATEAHVNVPGSWTGGAPLNNTTYYWRVTTTDAAALQATSDITSFTTSWTPPPTITGLRVVPRSPER